MRQTRTGTHVTRFIMPGCGMRRSGFMVAMVHTAVATAPLRETDITAAPPRGRPGPGRTSVSRISATAAMNRATRSGDSPDRGGGTKPSAVIGHVAGLQIENRHE